MKKTTGLPRVEWPRAWIRDQFYRRNGGPWRHRTVLVVPIRWNRVELQADTARYLEGRVW